MSALPNASRGLSWIRWGAIAAPVVLIGIFTLANRFSGPAPANASETAQGAALSGAGAAETKDVVVVERWIAERDRPVASPFEAAPILEPLKQPAGAPVSPGGLKVTSVFRSHDATIAAINGKLYREGQEVRPGVLLKSIDVGARKVVVTLADGREIEVMSGTTARLDR